MEGGEMKVISIWFGTNPMYERCARVLEHTLRVNSPLTDFEIRHVPDTNPVVRGLLRGSICGHDANNYLKTKFQMDAILDEPNGKLLCFMDTDTFVLGELSEIEEFIGEPFDIAVTAKENIHSAAPINSGVVFVRVSDKTKEWYTRWHEHAADLTKDTKRLRTLKRKYLGINQSSLALLMGAEHDLILKQVPCKIWNSTTATWNCWEEAKVIHVLGKLRMSLFKYKRSSDGKITRLVKLWKDYEAQAKEKVHDN
jgi:hypothetical protein